MDFKTFINNSKYRSDLIPGRIGPHIKSKGKLSIVNAVEGDDRLNHFGVWVILFDPAGDKESVVMPCDYSQMLPLIREIGVNKEVAAGLEMKGTKMCLRIKGKEYPIVLSVFQKNEIKSQFGYK